MGVLALFAVLAALGAGDYPPTVQAVAPLWAGAHTLQLGYGQYPQWNPTPYTVDDDGTGFAPTSTQLPDRTVSADGRHRYSIDPRTNVLSIDGVSTRRAVTSFGLAWSPDSTRLAYASGAQIWVTGVDGRGERAVHAGDTVGWVSRDELVVGVAGLDGSVFVVPLDGARPRRVLTGASILGGLAVSPDGTELAFIASYSGLHEYGSTLYVASLAGLDKDVRRLSPDICTVLGCPDTDGPDRLVGTKVGDLIIGGAGDDVIHAGDGQNIVYGQWGNDTILAGSYVDTVYGGGGNDVIRTGAGEDSIYAGPGRDVVAAGRGADHVLANDGERDVIDCGPGDDRARVDNLDVVRKCEHVSVVP